MWCDWIIYTLYKFFNPAHTFEVTPWTHSPCVLNVQPPFFFSIICCCTLFCKIQRISWIYYLYWYKVYRNPLFQWHPQNMCALWVYSNCYACPCVCMCILILFTVRFVFHVCDTLNIFSPICQVSVLRFFSVLFAHFMDYNLGTVSEVIGWINVCIKIRIINNVD